MIIESVELHNIKSYDGQGCCIEFMPGVNLIWGENGSGKTTILEAIGYCLFDALSYKLEQFIREGNSEGLVKLTFKHHDERRYAVVRDIKKTSGLKIQDVDSGRYLYTKRKDAENWLSDQLGVEFGKYGKELFQNAIGVAQGKMTGSFIVPPAARKKIFDPILRVDEYEQAYKKLGETKRNLDTLLREAQFEQSRLKGRLEQLPIVRKRLESLVKQISDGEMKLEMAQEQLVALETELSGLDELFERRNKLDGQISVAKQQLNNLEEQIQISEMAWQEAKLASETVEICEPGYKRYFQASDDIKQLEARREERDQLKRKFQDIEQKLSGVNQQILGLKEALAEVARAEERIVDLEPQVQQQAEFEARIHEAKERVEERKQLLRDVEKSQRQISELNERLEGLQAQITLRADLENDLQEYTTRRNNLLIRMEDLTEKININLTNREARNKEYQEARLDLQAWEAAIRQCNELSATIEHDQGDLLEMERRIRDRQDLIVELERLDGDHQTRLGHRTEIQQQIARCQQRLAELRDHLGLLMIAESAECPVCRRPLSEHELKEVETEFTDEENIWSTRLNETETDLRNAENEIKEIEKSRKTIQTRFNELPVASQAADLRAAIEEKNRKLSDLQIQIDHLSDSPNNAETLGITISQLTVEFQTLTEQQSVVQDERNQLDQRISRINDDIGNLPSPSQLTDLEAEIQRISKEKVQQEVEAGELVNAAEELQNLEQVLDRLGDSRKEQNQFVGIASRRAALEMNYQTAQNR
jgi:DNA repair protein SbcC/Rad50